MRLSHANTLQAVTFSGKRLVTGRDPGIATVCRMKSWSDTEFHERLAWARVRAGYKRPTDAARAVDEKPGTYRTWERSRAEDGRIPEIERLQKVARKFKVSWAWLLGGTGQPDDRLPNDIQVIAEKLAGQLQEVPEDKRDDALGAVEGVLNAFVKRAS